jgi:hypothetical protein
LVSQKLGSSLVLKDGRIVGTYRATFDAETKKRVAAGFERIGIMGEGATKRRNFHSMFH